MKEFYISFGQSHTHSHNGKTLDKGCIGIVKAKTYEEAHDWAMKTFKGVFCFCLISKPDMIFYPRGLINLN